MKKSSTLKHLIDLSNAWATLVEYVLEQVIAYVLRLHRLKRLFIGIFILHQLHTMNRSG
jgi:hypothetical protein